MLKVQPAGLQKARCGARNIDARGNDLRKRRISKARMVARRLRQYRPVGLSNGKADRRSAGTQVVVQQACVTGNLLIHEQQHIDAMIELFSQS